MAIHQLSRKKFCVNIENFVFVLNFFCFGGGTQSKNLRAQDWFVGWVVEGKVEGKLDLLVPGPGWTLSGDGGAGLHCPWAGAGRAAGAWPCQG